MPSHEKLSHITERTLTTSAGYQQSEPLTQFALLTTTINT